VVTLAPLEGLFGTVTGMIHAFGLLGASELGAPTAITGGIAEALIATAFGLLIAMVSLLPFNFLTTQLEQARVELETVAARLEAYWAAPCAKRDAPAEESLEEVAA
jgi:biopolymer transport protein ExbB